MSLQQERDPMDSTPSTSRNQDSRYGLTPLARLLQRAHKKGYCYLMSIRLMNTMTKYFQVRPKVLKQSEEFEVQWRQNIILLHSYNIEVARIYSAYPSISDFYTILAQYVDLTCIVLYSSRNVCEQKEYSTMMKLFEFLRSIFFDIIEIDEKTPNLQMTHVTILNLMNHLPERILGYRLSNLLTTAVIKEMGLMANVLESQYIHLPFQHPAQLDPSFYTLVDDCKAQLNIDVNKKLPVLIMEKQKKTSYTPNYQWVVQNGRIIGLSVANEEALEKKCTSEPDAGNETKKEFDDEPKEKHVSRKTKKKIVEKKKTD